MYALEELTNRQRDELFSILIKRYLNEDLTLYEELQADNLLEKIYYAD